MGMDKNSIRIAVGALGLLVLAAGMAVFNIDASPYFYSIISGTAAIILMIEVGIKKFTDFSKIRKFGMSQWISFVVAVTLLLVALLSLPFVGLSIAFIQSISGYGLLVGGAMLIIEAITV